MTAAQSMPPKKRDRRRAVELAEVQMALGGSAREVQDFGMGEKKPKSKGMTLQAFKQAEEEASVMLRSGEWGEARPKHFVAAWSVLHLKTYGVPADLPAKERSPACINAAKIVREKFQDNPTEMALYVWWAWEKERVRVEAGKLTTWRLRWPQLFSTRHVTDYLVQRRNAR